jgi:hypothetical protein
VNIDRQFPPKTPAKLVPKRSGCASSCREPGHTDPCTRVGTSDPTPRRKVGGRADCRKPGNVMSREESFQIIEMLRDCITLYESPNAGRSPNDISVTRSFLVANGGASNNAAFSVSRPGHGEKHGSPAKFASVASRRLDHRAKLILHVSLLAGSLFFDSRLRSLVPSFAFCLPHVSCVLTVLS